MEGKGWTRQNSSMDFDCLFSQPWALEFEGAFDLLNHGHICEQRSCQHYRVCGARPLLRFTIERHYGHFECYLDWALWVWHLRDHEADSSLV